jgi:hypothetical protein
MEDSIRYERGREAWIVRCDEMYRETEEEREISRDFEKMIGINPGTFSRRSSVNRKICSWRGQGVMVPSPRWFGEESAIR